MVRTSWSGHVHRVGQVGPVDAWVVRLLFEHLVRLVTAEECDGQAGEEKSRVRGGEEGRDERRWRREEGRKRGE